VAVGTTKKSAATDLPEVIREKGAPGLRGWPAVASHVFPDAGLTDINPELQQFAMDPRRESLEAARQVSGVYVVTARLQRG